MSDDKDITLINNISLVNDVSISVRKYTLENFKNIAMNMYDNVLEDSVIDQIIGIANMVGAADYIKTPQFSRSKERIRKKRDTNGLTNDDWDVIRNFKATDIQKKTGVAGSIDKIRVHLNKITDNNYNNQKEAIIKEIRALYADNNDINILDLSKIGKAIFDIASGNSFFSELYVNLYESLMKDFDFIHITLTENLEDISNRLLNIEYCDPNKDYDRFCEINKINEKRRSLTLFYVNLMKKGIIKTDMILDKINIIYDLLCNFILEEDKSSIVEEISELLYILYINSWEYIKNSHEDSSEIIKTLYTNICDMASKKAKSSPSLSYKTIFKFMDIRDQIEKLNKSN